MDIQEEIEQQEKRFAATRCASLKSRNRSRSFHQTGKGRTGAIYIAAPVVVVALPRVEWGSEHVGLRGSREWIKSDVLPDGERIYFPNPELKKAKANGHGQSAPAVTPSGGQALSGSV